jgi:von Willebrand factor type A domain
MADKGSESRNRRGLSIRPDQAGTPAVKTGSGQMIRFSPDSTESAGPGSPVDICFVFDTTGSMEDKIDGLVNCMVDFVREFARLNLDWRATTVPFGDLTIPGDKVVKSQPFVSSQAEAEKQLRQMPRFSGGGNEGESSAEAMIAGIGKRFRRNAVKILILLTDEPALKCENPQTVNRAIRAMEAICFVASPPLEYYQSWARSNGGDWNPIGPSMDTSSIVRFLRKLAKRVATVTRDVHSLGGGSVRKYLELDQGS